MATFSVHNLPRHIVSPMLFHSSGADDFLCTQYSKPASACCFVYRCSIAAPAVQQARGAGAVRLNPESGFLLIP